MNLRSLHKSIRVRTVDRAFVYTAIGLIPSLETIFVTCKLVPNEV